MPEILPIRLEAGDVDITLTPPPFPVSLGQALANDEPFPEEAFENDRIPLGAIGASASREFKIDKVKFSAGGDLFAGLGVYRSTEALLADLKAEGLDEPLMRRWIIPDLEGKNLLALRWGYNVQGAAAGAVAFGPTIRFGASGRLQGFYAILRVMDREKQAHTAVKETIQSWKTPRQIQSPDDLPAGAWVIAETDGELKLNLGLEYGFNYSWVRESLALGGLTGDFGLKVELGVKTQLRFEAGGRYALVLSRENERRVMRAQVFKLRRNGWAFAFDGALSAKVDQNLIPKNFDDFIRGVFNLNGRQALKDIVDGIEKWTDPRRTLKDLLGAELTDYAKELIKTVTGFDPETDIQRAIDAMQNALAKWRDLPHDVSSILYELLRRETPLDELRAFLRAVVNAADEKELADLIANKTRDVSFFDTPAGQWLAAVARDGVLSLLINLPEERRKLLSVAETTLGLLDGSRVEATLRNLQRWIEEHLGLEGILGVIDQASFAGIDRWLKKRLADFLGQTPLLADLEKIKAAVSGLRAKADEFYARGFQALVERYKVEFHASFQKITAGTALLDVEFDFDADSEIAAKSLQQAIDGDFTEILAGPLPGVALNKGLLTHEIKRRTHIDVSVPYFKSTIDHINESLASGEAIDVLDGRLWAFNLKAFDLVSSRDRMSKLSIALELNKKAGAREFSDELTRYNYTLRWVKAAARREDLERTLETLVDQYLASEFRGDGKQPFSTYLTALDKALDERQITGDDFFGDVLIGFDVSLPREIVAAWKKVPVEKKDPVYCRMSRVIQTELRRLIPLCYLQDVRQYQEQAAIFPLLVYSALPAINRVSLTAAGRLRFTDDDVYRWDFRDEAVRRAMIQEHCAPTLRNTVLPRVRRELQARADILPDYDDDNIGAICALSSTQARANFQSLLIMESMLIDAIHQAGQRFRQCLDARALDEAIESLAEFGAALTAAFNQKTGAGIYAGTTLRPLGSLLFLETAKVFDETLSNKILPASMLELIVLAPGSTFAKEGYLLNQQPAAREIALRHVILNVSEDLSPAPRKRRRRSSASELTPNVKQQPDRPASRASRGPSKPTKKRRPAKPESRRKS
jgi:hypothetical protein